MSQKKMGRVLHCLLMLLIWGSSTLTPVHAQLEERGRVSIQGSIIDTPCAIATGSRDQSIEMAAVTTGEIRHNGHGPERNFSISLNNCTLSSTNSPASDSSHFSMTFEGPSDDGLFSVDGVSGVGLQIRDIAGNIAIPGQPMPSGTLASGTQRLDYTLRLSANHDAPEAGEYHTTLRFKVDYF